jgi:branched-chain amino acid transport system ATP-binding protein
VLEVEGLEVHYNHVAALKGISLRVEEGSIVTLIGANGAGKSTTLWTISGLLRPTRGRITFCGESLDRLKPHEILRRGVSLVPEGRQVFPDMTVLENLRLGAYLERNPTEWRRRLEEVFAQFPILAERQTQLGGTLSGGEQQMLAIGRALMTRPKLLMLDEPSLGLAPLYVKRVMEILQDLNRKGISILVVEQKAQTALQIARRGYVLETGRIVLEDTGARLLDNEEVKRAYLGI